MRTAKVRSFVRAQAERMMRARKNTSTASCTVTGNPRPWETVRPNATDKRAKLVITKN
jgi:hypothetical protein